MYKSKSYSSNCVSSFLASSSIGGTLTDLSENNDGPQARIFSFAIVGEVTQTVLPQLGFVGVVLHSATVNVGSEVLDIWREVAAEIGVVLESFGRFGSNPSEASLDLAHVDQILQRSKSIIAFKISSMRLICCTTIQTFTDHGLWATEVLIKSDPVTALQRIEP